MADTQEVKVPDIGDFAEVEVIDVLVSPGDRVEPETPLITLESDKAAMDVPSPLAGIVRAVRVTKGDKVSKGSPILDLEPSAAPAAGQPAGSTASAAASAEPPAAPTARASGGREEIRVPDIGDFEQVEVIDVLVGVGDEVQPETPLVTLESDKAAMDVPSPKAGRIVELKLAKGDKVSKGDVIALIELTAGERAAGGTLVIERPGEEETVLMPRVGTTERAAPPAAAPAAAEGDEFDDEDDAAETPTREAPATMRPAIDEAGFAGAHASPSVRKFARELGVDLTAVAGSGRKGRVRHDDVKAWVKQRLGGQPGAAGGGALPKLPTADFAAFGAIESRPLSRIQRISGPRLHASWVNIPHVAQFDEADITELEQSRRKLKDAAAQKGIKLTPLGFILKACVDALKEFPTVNASLAPDGESLVLKKYYHLGFAVDTPNGLIVPVIRNVDRKDIYEIARDLAELSERARDGKLKRDDLQGGCFTVSSLGGLGGTNFTPIINPPEVAILGVARAAMKPVWRDGEFVPRLMLPFSFCYDHRVVDGALAVRFTSFLAKRLGEVQSLLQAIP